MFSNKEEVLEFAIGMEEASQNIYKHIAKITKDKKVQLLAIVFEKEEKEHQKRLVTLINNKEFDELNMDLKTFKNSSDDSQIERMTIKELFEFAIEKETSSQNLYFSLAKATKNSEIKKTLLNLSKDEEKHKNKFLEEIKKY